MEQSKALKLADKLDWQYRGLDMERDFRRQAAAELRRLSAIEAERDALRQKLAESENSDAESLRLYRAVRDQRDALRDEVERLRAAPAPVAQPADMREALAALLARDERNTCQHESTHRGGIIWTICDDCGAKWADDQGGKPEWQDPPEWIAARAALAAAPAPVAQGEPVAEVGDEFIHFLRKRPDGSHWPSGTKLYTAAPTPVAKVDFGYAAGPMDAERAAYFLRRFESEENLLGPNERAAVEFAIAAIAPMAHGGPVAWMHPAGGVLQRLTTGLERNTYTIPLYTTPPAAARVPLTDEQIEALIEDSDGRWIDSEFRIDGADLMRLLRKATGQEGGAA